MSTYILSISDKKNLTTQQLFITENKNSADDLLDRLRFFLLDNSNTDLFLTLDEVEDGGEK